MRLLALIAAIVAWSAFASAQSSLPEREYVLRDTGIRCAVAPCPNVNAIEVATGQSTRITGIDVSVLGLDKADETALNQDIYDGRLVVLGRIVQHGGWTTLVVSRVVRRLRPAEPVE